MDESYNIIEVDATGKSTVTNNSTNKTNTTTKILTTLNFLVERIS